MEQFLKNRLSGIDEETLHKIERHLVQDDRFREALKEAIEMHGVKLPEREIMDNINCPYCDMGVEIRHDDGTGWHAEDGIQHQQCPHCGKNFAFTTAIPRYYEATKVPCLNGGDHQWKKIKAYPPH